MKSTHGLHFVGLDHLRALAAFMVFAWHFTHGSNGKPIPFSYFPDIFPFALLDEGHTGVSLFMVLSGYLFARILDGKQIVFSAFLFNRALRLLPLLLFIYGLKTINAEIKGESAAKYALFLLKGLIQPTLPNGGWSITIEMHFYLILPLLLWLKNKYAPLLGLVLLVCVGLRFIWWTQTAEIQTLSYWTLIGRIDQFLLGILICHYRSQFASRHFLAIVSLLTFCTFYWYFDKLGGFNSMPSYPSPSLLWVFMPTIEAIAYAVLVAWYDTSFTFSKKGLSGFISKMGEYSYSIYLLHFFVVFAAAKAIDKHIMSLSNFYVSCAWAMLVFLLMMPIGYLSFKFIESPFLKFRKNYII